MGTGDRGRLQGFRKSNAWLASLAGHALLQSFYVANRFGSLNSWMCMRSGLLFGPTVALALYPRVGGGIIGATGQSPTVASVISLKITLRG